MDEPGSLILKLVLLLLLVLINAFFAMSEIAVISLNDNKVKKMAEDGDKRAKTVLKLTENSGKFLSTIQIGITLAGFLTSASASETFADMLAGLFSQTTVEKALGAGIIRSASVVVITIIMSYFSLVLGELVPKKIAMQKSEKISFTVAPVLLFFSRIFSPFVRLLSASTNAVLRLIRIDPHADEETVTEEEIRLMVDVGEEKGVIEDVQKDMINGIFEFDDMTAAEVMTHRTDMDAIDIADSLEECINTAINSGHSRIPVFEEDIDNIIGIVYIKDLLKYVGKTLPKGIIKQVMREPLFVPESKICSELFTEMTAKHIQMAVVVDEYGGTAGIVSMEDLIESIFGNIQDEYDNEDEEINKINETTFTIEGIMNIDEFSEETGIELPEGEYETVAGFLISRLGFLPKDGELNEIDFENVKFTVLSVENRRIEKVRVEVVKPPEEDEKEE